MAQGQELVQAISQRYFDSEPIAPRGKNSNFEKLPLHRLPDPLQEVFQIQEAKKYYD